MKQVRKLGYGLVLVALLSALVGFSTALASPEMQTGVEISEIRIDQSGGDDDEYFELAGPAGTSLDGLSYIVIGDGTGGSGVIEAVVNLDSTVIPSSGYFVAAESTFTLATADLTTTLNFENSDNVTHLLVSGFTGSNGEDLDTDDDGTLDSEPWSAVLDSVALVETVGSGDQIYSATTVGPDGTFVPGQVYRCTGGWEIGDFSPLGSTDTPGAPNPCEAPPPVELVINEIMQNPSAVSDSAGEWFELYNPTGTAIDIDGWTIADADYDSHLINNGGPLVVPAGGFLVLGNNLDPATNGGASVDYSYGSSWYLANGADEVILFDGSMAEIDRVEYDGGPSFPDPNGASMSLRDPSLDNNVGANWCESTTSFGSGDLGTPGAVNICEIPPVQEPVINEFVFNHTGADTNEYIEVFGAPDADYSAFSLLEIEGDGSGAGYIDGVFPVGTTDGSGFWFTGFLNSQIENGTVTILLVEGFTGAAGVDLDTDNDGLLDAMPWDRIVDEIAVYDGYAADQTYSAVVLDAYFDGKPYAPGGASRIPNGFDSDSPSDWVRNDFDGYGLPGFTGTQEIGEAVNTPGTENMVITVTVDPYGACGDAATPIHFIQGSGFESTDLGNVRVIEGIVVGDFDGPDQLGGVFVQEEAADADSNPLTSEGIFVYRGSFGSDLNAGDVVRTRGTVSEYNDLTELTSLINLDVCGDSLMPDPEVFNLPASEALVFEAHEGMLVSIDQELTVTGNYTWGRYGEVDLSVGGRLFNPTNVVEPGAPAILLQEQNDLRRIQLDDGSTVQNPLPLPPYIGDDDTLRAGDTTPGLMGVMSNRLETYEIHPLQAVSFTRQNHRPAEPPDVGGEITVASFNVLNYFTTIDSGSPVCGPDSNQDCRGADTYDEFVRQRDKIIAAIVEMGADVIGLMEIENHPADAAVIDLVQGLNDAAGAGTYDYIATGTIGTDAIKVALIYQPGNVSPFGAFAILDSSVDSRFVDTKNRPVLAQTFADADGALFTVAVNHLKSKGSDCNDLGDPDTGDGQGNCNLTRLHAAQALADWLASDPTGSGDADAIIIGDLNSYAMEDPIAALETEGYTNLIAEYGGEYAYSYVFEGQAGYLDHALSNPTLSLQVTGNAVWHINADEPVALNYNNYNQPLLYHPDPFASSDHDPVLTGLNPNLPPVCDAAYTDPGELWPVNHKFVSLEILGLTDPDGDALAVTIESIFQDEAVDDGGDGSSAPDAIIHEDGTFELRAERAGDGDGRFYHVSFAVDDGHSGTCAGEVFVVVPHDSGKKAEPAVDGGALFDSTVVPEPELSTAESTDGEPEPALAPTPEAVGKDKKDK